MSRSDVAQLRQQIAREREAMTNALSGYAITARHDVITNRYNQLGHYHEQLIALLGEQAAIAVVIEALEQAVE